VTWVGIILFSILFRESQMVGLKNHLHMLVTAFTPTDVVSRLRSNVLEEHLRDMVHRIGMQIAIPPRIAYSEKPGNTGYLALVGITTSHVTLHHWDCSDPGVLQYDVFSCREFDPAIVLDCIERFWNCTFRTAHLIKRYPEFAVVDLLTPSSDTTTAFPRNGAVAMTGPNRHEEAQDKKAPHTASKTRPKRRYEK
jgi:S-adenosylmethionine/arginine decarboxylase-like enzyme